MVKKRFEIIILVLITLVIMIFSTSCTTFEVLDETAENMLSAFLSKDIQKMSEMGHPDYRVEKDKYEAYIYILELEYGAELYESNIDDITVVSRKMSGYDSAYDGSVSYSEYIVTLSGEKYKMKCATLKNDRGEGIIQFDFGG